MEQLVARRAHNPKVVGSSPASATTKALEKSKAFFMPITERPRRWEAGLEATHPRGVREVPTLN